MQRLSIEVVSDTVCPWCFVGKRRLDAALSRFPSVDAQVRWKPYQLDRRAPIHGVNKLELYRQKFGEERVAQMTPRMQSTFQELGLVYSVGGMTGNTLDSHRLIHWSGELGGFAKQNALVEELFLNYFTQEKFINDRAVLLTAAAKVGLSGAEEYLEDPQNGLQEVEELQAIAMTAGIRSVPHFTIAGKALSGAQSMEVFVSEIAKCLAEGT